MADDRTKILLDGELLLWGLSGIMKAIGISRSTLERERAAGRFPKPDKKIGRKPLWKPATVRAWLDNA